MSKKRRHRKATKQGLSPETLIYTGDRAEFPIKVMTIRYSEESYFETEGFAKQMFNQPGGFAWTDVRGLSDVAMIEQIGSHFGMHPLALEDVLDTKQRAKLEEFDNGLFFIIPNLYFNNETLELCNEQISIFFGKNFVLSFQEDPDDTFINIRKRAKEGLGRIRKKHTDYLTYSIIDTVVDNYYTLLDDVETIIFELEESLHHNTAPPNAKSKLFHIKKAVNEFRHRLLPLREAITRFYRTESTLVDEANRLYLRDVVDHVSQIFDVLDNERDMLNGLEAYYQAESNNRLNNVMRLLTVISTIFIPLSFIAGIYGMNFDNMPELHLYYGYYYILGLMFFAMVGMLAYFRIKKWI